MFFRLFPSRHSEVFFKWYHYIVENIHWMLIDFLLGIKLKLKCIKSYLVRTFSLFF